MQHTMQQANARLAAKAIEVWLRKRQDGPYARAYVDVLELIEARDGWLWLAHLRQQRAEAAFTALLFCIDGAGLAHPAPGERFLANDLFTIAEVDARCLALKEGGA